MEKLNWYIKHAYVEWDKRSEQTPTGECKKAPDAILSVKLSLVSYTLIYCVKGKAPH